MLGGEEEIKMEQKEMLALLKSQMHMTYADRNEIAVHMNALSERLHQQEAEIEKLAQERGTMRASSPTMEWISVEDRLPGAYGRYISYNGKDIIISYSDPVRPGLWSNEKITHWMPLPKPPKPKVPTFKDVFLKVFPKAIIFDPAVTIDCCAVFPWLLDEKLCCQMDMTCEECWNQPYFEEEEGGE